MAESFDPYRDWLGVELGRPGANHYRLLGLKRFESNRQTILAAAQAAITRVEKTASATHAVERREVLAAIRTATRCLLDPAARARYDATLGDFAATSGNVAHPLPSAIPVATPLPVATPIGRPAASQAATGEANVQGALPPSLWDDEGHIPRTLETAQRGSSWRTSLAMTLGFLLASLVLAAGGYVVWRQGQESRPSADQAVEPAADVAPPDIAQQTTGPIATDVEDETAIPEPTKPASLPVENPVETPSETPPSTTPESAAKADPEKEPSPEFTQALNRVRAALLVREAGLARQRLSQAESLATSGAQEDTVRRLDALAEQLERFQEAVRRGLSKFIAAEELDINGELMSIIAVGPETVSLRIEGSRHDYTPATLPAPIALLVAKAGADENAPAAKVFFGAFFLVEPRGNPALARQLWESAAAAGEPVDELLRLLDADDLAIRREPVPDSTARAEARKRVAKRFAVTLRAAQSKQQKADLVEQLTKAAARADESADQFALLSEACTQAATDPRRALAIVDELARWFELERQALKTETLAKAAAASRDVDAAREVALQALALLDEVGHQSELARPLSLAAVSAARRARDAELLKKATARRRQIERVIRARGKPSAHD